MKYVIILSLSLLGLRAAQATPHDTIKRSYKDSIVVPKTELKSSDVHMYFKTEDKNSIIPVVLPILTLLLGIGLNRGWDWIDKKRQTKKQGQRWKTELELLALPISNQISFIDRFLVEHKKETFTIPEFTIQLNLSCTSFDSLDKMELIRYIEIFKAKDYRGSIDLAAKIDTLIGSLKHNYQLLNDKFKDYLSGISLYTLELNGGLQEIMGSMAQYGVALERDNDDLNDHRYISLLGLFNDQILPYRDHGDYDVFKLGRDFLPQFFVIAGQLRMDPRINPMIEAARKIHVSIQKLHHEKFYLESNLLTISNRYSEYKLSLQTIMNDL